MTSPRPAGGVALLGGGFLLVGATSVLLGPLIPELEAAWGITHAQAASLFVAQFGASSVGAALSSLRLRRSLVGGYAAIALGLAALAFGGWQGSRPAVAVTGFGLGLVIAASNLWVAHARPRRRGAALSTLNLLWGVGATSCPLLFAAAPESLSTRSILAALAAAAALLAALVAVRVPAAGRPATTPGAGAPAAPSPLFLGTVAAMLFLYVGSENAIGGWLVALADESAAGSRVVSLLIGSGFWGALLGGRLAAPWVLRRMSETALYGAALALAGGGTVLLLAARSAPALATGALAAGLGMAPLFPLTVSLLAAATAATRSRQGGWVLACGGLGGAALPWLTGRLAGDTAALAQGFLVPVVALAALAVLYAIQRTRAVPAAV